jgi:porin
MACHAAQFRRHWLVSASLCLLLTGSVTHRAAGADEFSTADFVSATPPRVVPVVDCDWLEDAVDDDLLTRARITPDDWAPKAAALQHGIDGRIEATQFYQGIAAGGTQRAFQDGGRNDYYVNVDGAKAGLMPGSFISLHGETRYGEDITTLDGALIPTSLAMNLPAPGQTITALTAVKYTQALSENFVVFGGKLNMLDDYLLNYSSGRGVDHFQNAALVFNPVLGRAVPYSTIAAGASVLQDMHPVLSLVVFDAVDRSTEMGIDDLFSKGAVIVAEGRLPVMIANRPGHQIVGGMWSSRQYPALSDTPLLIPPPAVGLIPGLESGSWAVYYNFDQTLWIDPSNPQRTWGVFGQTGIADEATNPLQWAVSFGIGGSSRGPLVRKTNSASATTTSVAVRR